MQKVGSYRGKTWDLDMKNKNFTLENRDLI
jgi:hypothetical protein